MGKSANPGTISATVLQSCLDLRQRGTVRLIGYCWCFSSHRQTNLNNFLIRLYELSDINVSYLYALLISLDLFMAFQDHKFYKDFYSHTPIVTMRLMGKYSVSI